MRISGKQLIAAAAAAAAAAAVLAVGGVWLHNRNQALEQLRDGIIKTLQTNGRQDGSGGFVCTNDTDRIWTDGSSVRLQSRTLPLYESEAVKESDPIVATFRPIKTRVLFNGYNFEDVEPSKPLGVLAGLEKAVNKLCINPTKSSPNNNPSPGQLLGSVALGFFER
jgi:hypothetical protein